MNRFAKDETGGITIFALVLLIFMLVITGMSVDFMRHEMTRADLQNALDRGVLAATNLSQNLDGADDEEIRQKATDLVNEYVASRNLDTSGLNISLAVSQTTSGRQVTASAGQPINTIFLSMIGIDTLDVAVGSGAEQGIPKLEIALILDVSGSMGRNSPSAPGTKLDQLKVAAKQFLDTVLAGDNADRTLVSIVPYSSQVALTPEMASFYNFAREHNYSSCFDYYSLDFSTTAMPMTPTQPYAQYQHFIERRSGGNTTFGCPAQRNAITPFSNDADELKAAVDNLATEQWTASYMGMKWGTAMLDPTSSAIVTAKIAANELPATFAGWPLAWDNPGVRKITVLMTDGQNTRLNKIKDDKYAENGPDYYNTNLPGGDKISIINNNNSGNGAGDVVMQDICTAAKQAGARSVVYTIGFELGDETDPNAVNAANQLEACATNLSTHYVVEGVEISAAFSNIADQIQELRLTN